MSERSPIDEAERFMLAFQAGDDRAFDRIVAAAKTEVFALARRYGLDGARSDDIAQETFIRIFKSRKSYRPEGRFRAWVLRIATNLVITEARAKKRARTVPLERKALGSDEEAQEGPLDPRAEPPGARIEQAELARAIEAALASLPDSQRLAIVLNRFHDQSYEEVGKALGLSLEAVKSLLFRARQNLKERLFFYLEGSTETSGGGRRSEERGEG